ncbi:1,4-alpha-glucan branching enzyme, partial [Francisella tularensis subsp. holarctica]|nr:1,4-alpha-glucan branching enzyme [Francisella tularensis subsp. holarctica]
HYTNGEQDIHYFQEGKHIYADEFMGAHKACEEGIEGIRVTTWAPNAKSICVIVDFNYWQVEDKNYMEPITDAGLCSVFIPNAKNVDKYNFVVT